MPRGQSPSPEDPGAPLPAQPRSSTAGYSEQADALVGQYESVRFDHVHGAMLHLFPSIPSRVLDVGAGTGRDAAALAARGHQVVAVEPTTPLRLRAMRLHPSARIAWLADQLPALAAVSGTFDLVLVMAVWMHLDLAQRRQAMRRLAGLLAPGGLLVITLRHGPVPAGRRMFEISGMDTVALATAVGLIPVFRRDDEPDMFARPAVRWTQLGLRRNPYVRLPSPALPELREWSTDVSALRLPDDRWAAELTLAEPGGPWTRFGLDGEYPTRSTAEQAARARAHAWIAAHRRRAL